MINSKSYVFISHSAQEADIIKNLVEYLQSTLPEANFFVSSSYDSLKPGDIWWDEIRTKIANAGVILACVSRLSIGKSWILFESGFGAGSGALLIPVILDDLPFSDLGYPLSMFQSVRLDEIGFANLVKLISLNTNSRVNNNYKIEKPFFRPLGLTSSKDPTMGIYLGDKRYDITSGWQRYAGDHRNFEIRKNYLSIGESFSDGFQYPPTDTLNAPWRYLAFRIKRTKDIYFYAVLKCLDDSTPKIFVSSIVSTWGFTGDPKDEYRVPIISSVKDRWQVIIINMASIEKELKSSIQSITGFRVRGQLFLSHIWCIDDLSSIPIEYLKESITIAYPYI